MTPAPTPSWVREIESTWLGFTSPPLADRIADAGWSPDPSDAYCPRCATTVGPHETTSPEGGCSACRGRRLPWSRAVRLGPYEGLLRDAILEMKFSAWRRLAEDLGEYLGAVIDEVIRRQTEPRYRYLLVPVPTTMRRRLHRGIDHTACLARSIGRVTDLPVAHALTRRHVPPQVSIPPSARAANVRGTMRLKSSEYVRDRVVILVDDVRTTGATLMAAARATASGGRPKAIWVATLAVAARI